MRMDTIAYYTAQWVKKQGSPVVRRTAPAACPVVFPVLYGGTPTMNASVTKSLFGGWDPLKESFSWTVVGETVCTPVQSALARQGNIDMFDLFDYLGVGVNFPEEHLDDVGIELCAGTADQLLLGMVEIELAAVVAVGGQQGC